MGEGGRLRPTGALELKIWIDADALPRELRDIILRASQRLKIEALFVANKNLDLGRGALATLVRVGKGADVADSYIVTTSAPKDLCVTADIPLAAALVAKGLIVLDPRGELYSETNIGDRLATRDLMASLREAGVQTEGPRPFDAKVKQKFAARLDSLLSRALREQ